MKPKALIAVVAAVVLTGLLIAIYLWWSLSDVDISINGLIALTLGSLLALGLAAGLMFLVFYSNRRGYDDEHHRGPPV